nr:Lrp/AsnC family transcriptional regulator [Tamlana laminarinivorans]
MRKLNKKKIFLGFHSFVNSSYLGVNIQAIIAVKLKRHSKEVVENFKLALKDNKEIVNTYHMASNSDFLLHVAVTDKDHLRNFVMDKLTALKSVKNVETSLIYDFVHNPLFPIYH